MIYSLPPVFTFEATYAIDVNYGSAFAFVDYDKNTHSLLIYANDTRFVGDHIISFRIKGPKRKSIAYLLRLEVRINEVNENLPSK